MARAKQLFSYQGRSFILHAVEVALASLCQPIIVVLAAYVEQIKSELIPKPVQTVTRTSTGKYIASILCETEIE
ncbi:hypothetical protein [Cylindrospermum stagnale]|uniref:hypothetical protein n=1 Tax=Cylindrospermum stagnale TaxID=142864 RepID=UPI0002F9B250|nr:hypothetical protein [Cylindrospermum stagnale]